MVEERDDVIERIAAALRPLPEVDGAAKARLLVAVAAERERHRSAAQRPWLRFATRRVAAGVGLAAAALIVVMQLRTPDRQVERVSTAPRRADSSARSTTLVTRDGDRELEAARQSVQLVFRAPKASSVRVVGDFNGWDKSSSPMMRDASSGLWSTTLLLRPGRHVYAYVVDDTGWVRDPRAPAARDADFGRPGSVLLVGRP